MSNTIKGNVEAITLYDYYHTRIDNQEKEETAINHTIDQLHIPIQELHIQEWELKKRREEESQLKKEASTAQLALFEERNAVIQSKNTIAQLNTQNALDKQKINELLVITGSVEQEVAFYKDSRPEKTQKFPISQHLTDKPKTQSIVKKSLEPACQKPKNVLRTIFLPSEQTNCLKSEVDEIKSKIISISIENDKILQTLKDERSMREEELRNKYIQCSKSQKELLEEIEKQDKTNYLIVKDLIDAKYLAHNEERKLNEECHVLRMENEEFRKNAIVTVERTKKESECMQKKMAKVSNEIVSQLKNEAQHKSEGLMIIKEQYEKIKQIHQARMKSLEEELAYKTKKCEDLKTRNELELEGYTNDIDSIRRKLSLYTEFFSQNANSKDDNDKEESEHEEKSKDKELPQEEEAKA